MKSPDSSKKPNEAIDDMVSRLSTVAKSNLFTKACAFTKDTRQAVPKDGYTVPGANVRLLCARLVLEETLELIKALGCIAMVDHRVVNEESVRVSSLSLLKTTDLDLSQIIDGACDTIYVSTGVLCAMGVPDLPHLAEVCRANDSKFPNGEPICHPETGKYLKPEGWVGPDHNRVRSGVESLPKSDLSLNQIGRFLQAGKMK
jgi:predicted HAD superfamily Cof-like phosphohydrolase